MERASSVEPCAIHRSHSPRNLTAEWHHVIPVAWQLKTVVAAPPFPGADTDGRGMLWDSRGVWLCPTGHRNVHTWIVAMMHAAAKAGVDDPVAACKAVKPHTPPRELAWGLYALQRYAGESGGSLIALTQKGEWGQF